MNQYRQEHESTEAWLNRIEVHMNSILECSNNKDILYERKQMEILYLKSLKWMVEKSFLKSLPLM